MLPTSRFVFTHTETAGREIRLGYRLEGPEGRIDLEERFALPESLPAPDWGHPAFARAVSDLHWMAGVSYWKTTCPAEITVDAGGTVPSPSEASFFAQVWTSGLGELFYTNGLDPRGRVRFPRREPPPPPAPPPRVPEPGKILLLVGGGKDSAVAREVLRRAGEERPLEVDLISVGDAPWIRRSAAAMGDRHLVMARKLDPQLGRLNRAGAYNGHVPVSAVIAFATRVAALAGGYGAVIAANERSASEGNLSWHGLEINHQWSKGLAFETGFQRHAEAGIPGGPSYFSLLRPLSEPAIARRFARHRRYFEAVTSCNANFRQAATLGAPAERWCGHCPKCLFVYLILTPHLSDEDRRSIFGETDLLDREENLPLLEELLGIEGHKPFECVGTPEETAAALTLLHRRRQAARGPVSRGLELFRRRALPELSDPDSLVERVLAPSAEHRIPEAYAFLLGALEDPRPASPLP